MDGDWTWVEHPVTRLRARIARSALAHHLRSGWTEATAPPVPTTPQPAAPSPEVAPATEPQAATPEAPAEPDPLATYAIPQPQPAAPSPQDVPPPGGQETTGE